MDSGLNGYRLGARAYVDTGELFHFIYSTGPLFGRDIWDSHERKLYPLGSKNVREETRLRLEMALYATVETEFRCVQIYLTFSFQLSDDRHRVAPLCF